MSWGLALILVLGLALAVYQGLRSARDRGPSRDEAAVGVHEGLFTPCPDTPNCISTQASPEDRRHYAESVPFVGSPDDRLTVLLKVLSSLPRVKIIEQEQSYVRAEFLTAVIRFVDDVEFYLPPDDPVIHIRSASRVGFGDLGLNRRRYNRLARLLAESKE